MPERLEPGSAAWRHYGHQHVQRYAFATDRIVGRRVLDLACGVGYGSYILAQGAGREVTGVDLSVEAVAYGRKHYQRPGLRIETGDALQWGAGEEVFDTVVSFETIEHLPDPAAFAVRLAAHVRPGGRLIISAPNTLQHKRAAMPIENPFHVSEPDHATFRGWLTPHFEIEAEWEQSAVTPLAASALDGLHDTMDSLRQRWWLRAANRIEHLLRGHRPSGVAATPRANRSLLVATELFPLLPERWSACDVFVFICRRPAPARAGTG
ncbi:MAG: methyltransferase domain-containing protein [Opitutaceae bacterium]|nr:methyltransferase domain-containing protein [Opitutaceae bacterium]